MFPQLSSITIGIDPIIHIGFLEIRYESIMYVVAFSVILLWLWHFGKRVRIKPEFVIGIGVTAIAFGLVGARLVHIIDFWGFYTSNPSEMIGLQGMAIFGGILGAALGAWIYCRVRGVSFAPLFDLAAPGIILGQAVGRIGCTINGDASGTPTSLPWGVIYTHPDSHATFQGVAVHPTQVYQIIWNLIVFALH